MQRKTPILTLTALIIAGSTTFIMADNHAGDRPDRFPSFEELDINGDQMISPDEVAGHAQAHFNKIDTNKDGSLSAEEIAKMHMARAAEMAKSRHAKMVEKLDKDGDGLLSFVEMQAARKTPNTDRMFKHLDNDGDGMISAEEFASLKERGHKGRKKNKP